jgi:hypothetical protein
VRSLHSHGGRLYIGGDFTTAGGVSAQFVASWDGASWSPLQGGADYSVWALGSLQGEVHAGGYFQAACGGALASPGWARYLVTGAPWIAYHPTSLTRASGQDAFFSAEPATGYTGSSYRWYRNGMPLHDNGQAKTTLASTVSGAATRYLSIRSVSAADVGYYQLVVTNGNGSDTSSTATLTVDGTTDAPPAGPPIASVFEGIGPNPARGSAHLVFTLAREARVRVNVRDVAGRRVRVMDVGVMPPGLHRSPWDGRGSDGTPASTGLYFVELEVEGRPVGVRRLTLLR